MTPKTYLRTVLGGILFYISYFLLGIFLQIFFKGSIVNIDQLFDIYQLPDFIVSFVTPLFYVTLFFKGFFLWKKYPDHRVRIFLGITISLMMLFLIFLWFGRSQIFPVQLETVKIVNIPYFYRITQ